MSLHLSSCSNVPVKWKDLNAIQFAQNFTALESYWIISWQSAKPHYYYSASDHTWYWLWRQEALLRPFLPFAIEKTMDHKSSKIAHFCSLQIYKTKYYLVVILRLRPSASPIPLKEKKSFRTCACILQVVQTSCFRPTEPLLIRNDLSPIQFVQNSTAVNYHQIYIQGKKCTFLW